MKMYSKIAMKYIDKLKYPIIILLVTAIYHLFAFSFYLDGTLDGRVNNHILAGQMFGVPTALQAKGIEPLYFGPGQTGWDGQFYYYISNDLLARADTSIHIDSPSYRYQRVGMSLYAATVAFVTGQTWVSPATYLLSYFALVLVAAWFCARLLIERGLHPLFALFWPLSVGTQITMFNALPDAAADAFLILGIAALQGKRFRIAIVPLTLAALSREVYVFFPVFIGLMYWVDRISQLKTEGVGRWLLLKSFGDARLYWLAVPVLVTMGWHIFVTLRFGVTASSQARGILGGPLVAWYHYFITGLYGNHPLIGTTVWARVEALCLLLFLITLILAASLSLHVLVTRKAQTPLDRGLAVAAIALALLYACFGPTVAMHYTGYLKAAAVFAIIIPLLLGLDTTGVRWHGAAIAFLAAVWLTGTYYNWQVRILPSSYGDRYTLMSQVKDTREQSCFTSYDAAVEVRKLEFHERRGIAGFLSGRKRQLIATIELTNTGQSTLVSTRRGLGSVHMSYHWLDEHGRLFRDGVRSAIVKPLAPGESTSISVVARLPTASGRYTLRLSPVQEGCAWFYLANSKSAKDIGFDFQ